MPSAQDTRKWLLEIAGQRKGPYSVSQIYSLLKEGAIFPATRVLCTDPDTRPTTVQDLIRVQKESLAGQAPTLAPKTTPPTGNPTQNSNPTYEDYGDEDPVNSLFTTLQVAKDRQTKINQKSVNTRSTRRVVYEDPAIALTPSTVFRWRWLGFVFAGSLITGYTALKLLQSSPQTAVQNLAPSSAPAPARTTASAPAATPGQSTFTIGQSKIKIVDSNSRSPQSAHTPAVNRNNLGISTIKAPAELNSKNDDRDRDERDADRDRYGNDRDRDREYDNREAKDVRDSNEAAKTDRYDDYSGESRNPATSGSPRRLEGRPDSDNPESKGKDNQPGTTFEGNPETGGVVQQ